MRVEHHKDDDKPLPRTWWKTAESRRRDLEATKRALDAQEKAWNAMVNLWTKVGGQGPAPPRSPGFLEAQREPKIQSFP